MQNGGLVALQALLVAIECVNDCLETARLIPQERWQTPVLACEPQMVNHGQNGKIKIKIKLNFFEN